MIIYRRDLLHLPARLFQCTGSVFPAALMIALPCSAITAGLKLLIDHGYFGELDEQGHRSVIKDSSAWSGFVFLVGFLIVFRTSQAYARYWEGCKALTKMRSEWYSAAASLLAYCKHSCADDEANIYFQHILIRLFSLLHGVALAAVEDSNCENPHEEAVAFKYELVDPGGLDPASLRAVKNSYTKVELVYQWIHQLVIENLDRSSLKIPPPMLTVPLSGLNDGLVAFRDSMMIGSIPFPFPYAQVCEWLLILHWFCTPLVTSQYATTPWWAALFSFLQVYVYWALNAIAIEVENPFGMDSNDLDAAELQAEMNDHLLLLMEKSTKLTPFMAPPDSIRHQTTSLAQTWAALGSVDDFSERPSAHSEPVGSAQQQQPLSPPEAAAPRSSITSSTTGRHHVPATDTDETLHVHVIPMVRPSTVVESQDTETPVPTRISPGRAPRGRGRDDPRYRRSTSDAAFARQSLQVLDISHTLSNGLERLSEESQGCVFSPGAAYDSETMSMGFADVKSVGECSLAGECTIGRSVIGRGSTSLQEDLKEAAWMRFSHTLSQTGSVGLASLSESVPLSHRSRGSPRSTTESFRPALQPHLQIAPPAKPEATMDIFLASNARRSGGRLEEQPVEQPLYCESEQYVAVNLEAERSDEDCPPEGTACSEYLGG